MPSSIGKGVRSPSGPNGSGVHSEPCQSTFCIFMWMAAIVPNGSVVHGTPMKDWNMPHGVRNLLALRRASRGGWP